MEKYLNEHDIQQTPSINKKIVTPNENLETLNTERSEAQFIIQTNISPIIEEEELTLDMQKI